MAEREKQDVDKAEVNDAKNEGETEGGKKGLSTALLIKIAIGLSVVLIALMVFLFFFKNDDSTSEKAVQEMVEQTESNIDDSELELPASPDDDKSNEITSGEKAGTMESAEKALLQMIKLQEQISTLQKEKQALASQLEELTKENSELKNEIEVYTREMSSSEVPLDQLINTPNLPRDYQRGDYANTPKFELEPKWGEFESPSSGGRQ